MASCQCLNSNAKVKSCFVRDAILFLLHTKNINSDKTINKSSPIVMLFSKTKISDNWWTLDAIKWYTETCLRGRTENLILESFSVEINISHPDIVHAAEILTRMFSAFSVTQGLGMYYALRSLRHRITRLFHCTSTGPIRFLLKLILNNTFQ